MILYARLRVLNYISRLAHVLSFWKKERYWNKNSVNHPFATTGQGKLTKTMTPIVYKLSLRINCTPSSESESLGSISDLHFSSFHYRGKNRLMFCARNMFCPAIFFHILDFHLFKLCFVLSTPLKHKSLLKTSKYQHKTSPNKVNGGQQKILTFLT